MSASRGGSSDRGVIMSVLQSPRERDVQVLSYKLLEVREKANRRPIAE